MFGVFFVAAAFGAVIQWRAAHPLGQPLQCQPSGWLVWVQLMEGSSRTTNGAVFFRVTRRRVALWCCWAALGCLCLVCLYMLERKIRGAEVVR